MSELLNTAMEGEPVSFGQSSIALFGTVGKTTWRDELMEHVKGIVADQSGLKFFDPRVENWTPEDRIREQQAKALCGILVFVITPQQEGWYTLLELFEAAYHAQFGKSVFICFEDDHLGQKFEYHQRNSIDAVCSMLADFDHLEVCKNVVTLAVEVASTHCELVARRKSGPGD